MIQVETSLLIRCPLEAVRAYVSDPHNSPAWQLELAGIGKLAECEAAYNFDCADGDNGNSSTCVTWAGRVSVRGRYRSVEALIGQIAVLQADASLTLLKKLLETSDNGNGKPVVRPGMGQ